MHTHADIVIVGAGISGSVLAERYANAGKQVVLIEKRGHIAGNCYDYVDANGILVSKYGAHLFHTNDASVWNYVNRFSNWYSWEHKVLARVDGRLVPIPVNRDTVNTLFGLNLQSDSEMQDWLDRNRLHIPHPANGREAVLSKVGPVLYEKMFRDYTKKQWDKYPEELDASVLQRIPVRTNTDPRYFTDKYQALPVGGYTQMFAKIVSHPNIKLMLNTDFFDVSKGIKGYHKLFYTGPIDRYFERSGAPLEKLEYRSINFVSETVDREFYQENSVVNYPGPEVAYTRIVEYKHFGNQKSQRSTIVREYTVDHGEPYYPVPCPRNNLLYERYRSEAAKLSDVHFVGRLANYKYFNMDEAFKNALALYESLAHA